MEQQYRVWLIEDNQRTIAHFMTTLEFLGGELLLDRTYHAAFNHAPRRLAKAGMVFVDNSLEDQDDVGAALVRRIKSFDYRGVVVSSSFKRLRNPIEGTDIAFPKDHCTPETVKEFIIKHYPVDI